MNEAEQRFAAYLDSPGYAWKHEPDYELTHMSGVPAEFATVRLLDGHTVILPLLVGEDGALRVDVSKVDPRHWAELTGDPMEARP